MPPPSAPAATSRGDVLQGVLTLAPAALLLGGAVYGIPTHTSAASGWILLACLPALGLALARRPARSVAGLLFFLPVLLLALGSWLPGPAGQDTFEAARARIGLSAWFALLLCGASLGPAGRQTFVRGLILLAGLGLISAWVDTWLQPVRAFAGALENTGDLSESVLPGALLGYAALHTERGPWRVIGLATGALYLVTVGHVPVLAGGLSFLTAISIGALLDRSFPLRALPLAALLFGAAFAIQRAPHDSTAQAAPAADVGTTPLPSPTFGGFAFRRLTWARIPALLADRPATGTGAGQFAREFPPYRDPREIELSSLGRRSPGSTEVEHAHNDWLQPFAEYGLLGGLAWLGFGIACLRRAVTSLRRGEREPALQRALGVAALGVLANATFNSPLFEGPAFAICAPLLGCLLGQPSAGERTSGLLRAAALLLALAQAPAALSFVRHGAALAPLAREATTRIEGRLVHRADAKRRALERALSARPDSTIALVELAHLSRIENGPPEDQLGLWREILEQRPWHFEALLSAANLSARLERFDEASALFERAAAADPSNPTLVRNRLLLALRAGDIESVLGLLADDTAGEALDAAWLERSAAELLLSGRPHLGLPLLERANPELRVASAEQAYALSKSVDVELLADALLAHAHFTWAREHALAGDPASAVRSYRQCLTIAGSYPDLVGGARRVHLELAAALALRGQLDQAAEVADPIEASAVDVAELPAWAREELRARGWIDG